MAVFKCKMCGGDLEILDNATVCECEYCGTKQTLPKLDDEKRVQLYDRANYFRRENEFDKAMGIYEMILSEANDDAESYWGIVLCRYGIEYVEDPRTHRRIPTVNRAQFTSIFDDEDYKKAIQYADTLQKEVYEAEATVIDKIQKGILDISNKEEPFDVFICYKETDENGQRTKDSVYAQSIYDWLVKQGYKVFFSRITLEDKLGSAYEPYIFAALNSARVMLVVGTKKEHFNAVWVKNEWSRYLLLIKAGKEKTIIPVYKDISPYDLPEEFQYLQAQDMNKIGFSQDLGRGIRKLIPISEPATVKETVVVNQSQNSNVAPLLERAFMFLEDGDWNSADEYCEKVLDLDPKNAEAYLGKLMAELQVKKQEFLKVRENPFDNNANYKKVIRFADEKLKSEITGYIEHIKTRNEKSRVEDIYNRAKNTMAVANSEHNYKEAAKLFEGISEYLNSTDLAKECYEKAEIAREEKERKEKEEKAFLTKRAEEERMAAEKRAEIKRIEKEEKSKKRKKVFLAFSSIILSVLLFVLVYNIVFIPNGKYNDALVLMEAGKYSDAITVFETLGGYKDSVTKIKECNTAILDNKYNDAIVFMDAGKYTEAITAFEALNGYKDSSSKIEECNINIYGENVWEKIKDINVGDTYKLGSYEQDNNTSNGYEDIEWLVLSKQGTKILVVSKYALDYKPYNVSNTDVTWQTCTLRKWLNDDFIDTAFSSNEKKMISINDMKDKVFLLNVAEVDKYFDSNSDRQCEATDYAIAKGANVTTYSNSHIHNCIWWLRSTNYSNYTATVNVEGEVIGEEYANGRVDGIIMETWDEPIYSGVSVRPAMWIEFDN